MVETELAAIIAPWLTPTSLFVLLNIVLATIFLANNHNQSKNSSTDNNGGSNNVSHHYESHNYHQDYYEGASLVPPPPQLVRAPSLFSRVASFNFSNFYSEAAAQPAVPSSTDVTDGADPNTAVTVTRAPSLLYRVASFNFSRAPAQPPQQADVEQKQKPQQEEAEVKVKRVNNKKMKKKEVSQEVKEKVNKVEEKKVEEVVKEAAPPRRDDEEVDSKAEVFINMFKQNLKMQRLQSLQRYWNNSAAVATWTRAII